MAHEHVLFNLLRGPHFLQLQLSLSLANDLYEALLLEGEPIAHHTAARRVLALQRAPLDLCEQVMRSLATEDPRFYWYEDGRIGLNEWSAADPDLSDVAFVVVDLETTGSRPGPSKITEIGAVRIEGLAPTGTFHTLVNPKRPISPMITQLTGITYEMVRDAPSVEQVLPDFLRFVDGAVLIAHNAPFDLGFLNYELSRTRGLRIGEGALDTVRMSRRLAPGLPNHRLATVASALGFPGATFHRALADAEATAHVFLVLAGRLQERGVTTLQGARAFLSPSPGMRMRQLLSGEIPRRPGAYRFLGKEGAVLYVGKAEHLRDRVRSYFIPSATHSRRIRQALRQVESIQWEELETPLEAVVREQELILEHRPPCNVRGRRPESYVYLRAAMSKGTLRLQHSRRQPAVSLECTESGDPSVPLSISVGPFRGPARVKAGLELLRRCYPLARCTRGKAAEGCIYLQTGRCLAPCTGDPERIEQHNRLVTDVLSWLAHPEGPHEIDPLTAAGAALRRLSSAQRFEEAESVRSATEDLTALRESYRALSEATDLYLAVLFPQAGSNDSFPSHVRVNVVWGGSLVRAFSVSAATASLEISRVARSLDPPKPRGLFVAVTRERLDALLAVRRWLLDSPSHEVIRFQEPIENEEGRQLWARATASRALELLAGLP